ncbi:(2,3-dihydroxybenzoyl)adenylate synthase [Streptosporangium sp. NPDC000396]|uniref:(2,3-dihydroxybenzoyl)adenylate synthase n=1 Tax=Streptosporangium sp. NPDC000396 TaxID=3366185 RepID=UPI0036881B93
MTTRLVQPSRTGIVPWPDDMVARYVAKGYWEGRSLGERLLAAADATPDTTALVDGELRLSYRELMERADGAALRLHALGLRPDDRIVVQLPNCWEFVVLTLACLRLGVLPVMALPAHRRHEMSYLVDYAEARAIVVPDTIKGFDHQAMARAIADDIDCVEHVVVAGTDVRAGSVDLRALCAPDEDPAAARGKLDGDAPDSRSVAVFLLSGGTTGLPKLIARTHDDYAYNVKRNAEVCGSGPGTVYLAVLPLGHNFPLLGILGTLMAGGRVVLASSPVPEQAFPMIERERVTAAALVPAIAQRWLEYRESDQSHDLGSLGLLVVGGSRLADHVALRVGPTLGCTLMQGYGMAEGLVNLTRLDDPDEVICHTQGRPICPDDEILIVDEQGEPVAPGEPGVLLTRGPYTPRGYYRAEEQNARAFVGDGWYRTGDIVRLRPDGNLIVEGRDKDMINRGGEKVSAEEVENFAYQVDGVSLAAAVAMPDPDLGERVCLYVVPHSGTTVCLEDVRAVMEHAGVARFKLPERLVLVGSLPSTNVGKIDKKALRADIDERLSLERAAAEAAVRAA